MTVNTFKKLCLKSNTKKAVGQIGEVCQVHPYDMIGAFLLWNKSRISRQERIKFNNYMKTKFKLNSVYVEKYHKNLCLYTCVKLRNLYMSQMLKIPFNESYIKWLRVKYPEYRLDKQEMINLKYYINKQFLFDKISIPGHTNVDGILGFQLKSDTKPRYGILISKRKNITQTHPLIFKAPATSGALIS